MKDDSGSFTRQLQGRALPDIIEIMEEAALRAGDEILTVYRASDVTAHTKADGSPLTEADLRSQKVILDLLSERLPFPIFAEESAIEGPEIAGSPFFLVDPLDGTKDFLARNDEFTVNIALVVGGRAIAGVIGVPALGLLYAGGQGLGVWRLDCGSGDRTVLAPTAVATNRSTYRLLVSRFHDSPAIGRFAEIVGDTTLLRAGSALKFCRLTEGAADLYFRAGPTCEWDTAAGHCLVREHGFRLVALPEGEELLYGKKTLRNPDFLVVKSEEVELFLDIARRALGS